MITAQGIDVAVRLTLFFLLIWPPLRLLAQMLEGPIWRSYGLTPRPHLVLMEGVWERRFTRLLQFAAVVLVYDWIGQDMGGGQATFWIAVGIVYSLTYWVTQAADWTLDLLRVSPMTGRRIHLAKGTYLGLLPPDDPIFKEGPRSYSPHRARTYLGSRPTSPGATGQPQTAKGGGSSPTSSKPKS